MEDPVGKEERRHSSVSLGETSRHKCGVGTVFSTVVQLQKTGADRSCLSSFLTLMNETQTEGHSPQRSRI